MFSGVRVQLRTAGVALASSDVAQVCGAWMLIRLERLLNRYVGADVSTAAGRAIVEERYWSLRRQVPVVYLLGFVNLSGLELATTGQLSVGANLPTFIAACGIFRLIQWFVPGKHVSHELMVRRMKQTVWFATAVCVAVCARCLQLLHEGDPTSQMA